MSIFKVLEGKITQEVEDYSDFLSNLSGDSLKGAEFMFYSLANIFKDKTIDEIESGMVDSSYKGEKYDFGIDAIYITGSKDFIEQKEQLDLYNEDTKFTIHLFQFKRGTGVSQADLLKFNKGVKKILVDEDLSDTDNLFFYNRMLALNEIKTKLYNNYSTDNIKVVCHIVFGGVEQNLNSNPLLVEELDSIKSTLTNGGFTNNEIRIADCQKLINANSKGQEIIDIIEYEKTLKYITGTADVDKLNGYICIVKGKEIAELVRKHQTSIFEANIRDYYKRSDLNSKIATTSSSTDEAKYFWSFNNGLTMTCNKVQELPNDKYRLYNLQIVNGCQTSNAIYSALKNKERINELLEKQDAGEELNKKEIEEINSKEKLQFNDETSLLVKIVETNSEDLIYRITETTNSQTPIKAFSLKANDNIQLLIEQYLESKGVWYERRLNFYKNKGKKNIVNIQKLFQLFTSHIFLKPSQVKTRPKSMFINSYEDVFPHPSVQNMNYALYLIPIKTDIYLTKKIREIQRNDSITDGYQRTILSYGKFHLGCFILSSILKNEYNLKGIVKNEARIQSELENNIDQHFTDALLNFEKTLKSFVGNRKESIVTGVRKTELDSRITKFIKNRK
ncbi:AIPR family protein [Lutibacter flavus]|uniref:AIPR protein n=1 Tax=Lutibacter flavus TaxID=691689 RepID=A0A238VUF1_9FLAO|nr:AIPR family protein [Lutibacter flavus]SNR37811.1 AIPR protein [Lutibacter flavus]